MRAHQICHDRKSLAVLIPPPAKQWGRLGGGGRREPLCLPPHPALRATLSKSGEGEIVPTSLE